jgi:four helix bundle protein
MLYLAMDDFTQFDAFERCREYARGIAKHLNCGVFSKDPVLTNALRKTLLSVYSNFGEGFERDGNREFAQFVAIAKGSIGETRAQLIYALDFGYLKPELFSDLDQLGRTATKCLGGLIRYLNGSNLRGRKFKQRNHLPNDHQPPEPSHGTPNASSQDSELRPMNGERRTANGER